jgi:hypothetical protein
MLLLACWTTSVSAADMEITPFRTVNQSPLVQIFGIPADSTAIVTDAGHFSFSFSQDAASNYTYDTTRNEDLLLDGESYRWTLAARYGIGERFEAGIDIPFISQSSGFMDGFIDGWHKTFGLPRGGRNLVPRNRIVYGYVKDGVQKLNMQHSESGIGDISLHGGMKLYDRQDDKGRDRLTLRTSIKLPTGDSTNLMGSGSTDFTLSLCGSMNGYTEWGSLGVFGSAGAVAMTPSDRLRSQHNSVAAFGTFGLGWGPTDWISFKVQLNGHTPLYHGSSLDQLSKSTLMLVGGGTLKLPGGYFLDIGVSEDVVVATSPDVALHLGLHKQF